MDDFYRRGFGFLSVAVLGYALFQVLTPFWGALAWSICLAVLLAPLQLRLTRRFGEKRLLVVGALLAGQEPRRRSPLAIPGGRSARGRRARHAACTNGST